MRDLETTSSALTIAETALGPSPRMHTNSAAESIKPHHRHLPRRTSSTQIRTQLSFVLEGVVTADARVAEGQGEGAAVMAAEILVVTPAIRALIRDEQGCEQIPSMMQAGKISTGMQTLNDAACTSST